MYSVLVVEDDINIRETTAVMLNQSGYKAFTASSVKEALTIIDDAEIDLIISDIMMEPEDGYQLLKKIGERNLFPPIPFIFITAKVRIDEIRLGMQLGADDYITKPFKMKDLLGTVEARLKKHEKIKKKFNEISMSFRRNLPHELRTPLTGILGFSEFLATDDTLPAEQKREYAININRAARKLLTNIEKIVAYAEALSIQLNAGLLKQTRKNKAPVEIGLSIESVAGSVADNNRGLSFAHMSVSSAKIPTIETFFESIVKELVDNAFKFSPSDSKVKIIGEPNGELYNFIVENEIENNIDIDELKSTLALSQLSAEKLPTSGLSIGVPLIKNLCEIINAEIDFDIIPDRILRWTVKLPRQ